MTDTPQDQPLWRIIDRAWWSLVDTSNPHASPPESDQAACVIRAVADWLVPEEVEPKGMQVAADTYSAQRIRQHERQALRQRLLAEADRARAALAEPEPEAPTDEKLRELWMDCWDTSEECGAFQFARAVLARWGNRQEILDSSSQPIPVSERLPGPEDSDPYGRCWWYGDGEDLVSHWLPAHALPLPGREVA